LNVKERMFVLKLRINGEWVELAMDTATVEQVLAYFELQDKIAIVEHNMQVLEKAAHRTNKVADGDTLEIVHFVGGG